MSQKIVCKGRKYDVIVDCSKIQRNIFKILKLLNDIGSVYLFSDPESKEFQKLDKGKEKSQYVYEISEKKAVQLVWRSGYLSWKLGVGKEQERILYENKYVGKNNQLDSVIADFRQKMERNENSRNRDVLEKKLGRLEELRRQIQKRWQSSDESISVHKYKLYSPPMALLGSSVSQQQKGMVLKLTKKGILDLDMKILQESIMFIQQLQTGHCIVSLEQSYPSFIVYKQLFKSIVGVVNYNRGLKEALLAKEEAYSKGMKFVPEGFGMCHQCRGIQKYGGKEGTVCARLKKKVDTLNTPLGFEQVTLLANYDCLYGGKGWNKLGGDNSESQTRDFWKYSHPFSQSHFQTCRRYYCGKCITVPQVKIEENKVEEKAIECAFCRGECKCSRCRSLAEFNKMMGFFHVIGGDFQQILQQLMFLNLASQRVFMQLVSFDKEPKEEAENHLEGVQIDKNQKIPYYERVQKMQEQFSRKINTQSNTMRNEIVIEDEESLSSNEIFPNLQKLYEELVSIERGNGIKVQDTCKRQEEYCQKQIDEATKLE